MSTRTSHRRQANRHNEKVRKSLGLHTHLDWDEWGWCTERGCTPPPPDDTVHTEHIEKLLGAPVVEFLGGQR